MLNRSLQHVADRRIRRLALTMRYAALLYLSIAFWGPAPAAAGEVRVGDAGSEADATRLDEHYADMKQWATAGVRGGIPARSAGKVVKTCKPADDLQAAIDDAARGGGGVVLLAPGTYPLGKRLDLRSGVILRGQDKAASILQGTMRSPKLSDASFIVRIADAKRAALEDLTIQHAEVARLGLDVYHEKLAGAKNDLKGVADLHVGGVSIERAEDCWVDNCFILHSGSHPYVGQGTHLTLRDTVIDGAFNKGDSDDAAGSGYVYFASSFGLMYNCTVRNVRHALVLKDTLAGQPCKYNVIVDCNLEGDVNFHGNRKDEGHNLIEGTFVHSPPFHGWPAWAYWKKTEIGPENLVYKCWGWGGGKGDAYASTDPAKVYTYTGLHDPNVLGVLEGPAPRAATLYAVTGTRPTNPETLGPWPRTPAEALKAMEARMIKSPLGVKRGL